MSESKSKVYIFDESTGSYSQPYFFDFDVIKFIEDHKNDSAKGGRTYSFKEDFEGGAIDFDRAPKKVGMLLCVIQAYKMATSVLFNGSKAIKLAEDATKLYFSAPKSTPMSGYKYPDSDGDKSMEYRKALEHIGEYTCDSIIPTEVIRNRVRLLTSDNENAVKSSVKFLYTIIKYGIVRAKQAEIDYGMDMAKAILLDEVMVPCNGLKEALAEAAFNNFGIKAKEAVEKL